MNQEINALIIGGGIAGLSTAIVLGQQNIKATVIEITNRSALGASVAINNRAVDALESLGVLEKCIEAGTAFDSKTSIFENMFDSAGNPLSFPSPPGRPDDRLPASIQIYRPTFAQILQEKAEKLGATIKLNTSFTEIENSGNKVNVTFTDDSEATFDLVIGADGVRSKVRSQYINSDIEPEFTQSTAIRWMHRGKLDGQHGMYNHLETSNIVLNAELPNDFHYFITGIHGPARHIDQDEARSIVHDILSDFTAPRTANMKALLSSDHNLMVNPFYWLLVPKPWHKGRIVLIGDAAHATTANLSYGAGLALEDAVTLGEEIARLGDIGAALVAYEDRRFERVQMVVETSVALMHAAVSGAPADESGRLRHKAYSQLMEPF